jgi:flagellar biosynthesis/type III secretory pathway protein FliH
MQDAVIKLAAARIGMAIDEMPEIILKRIDALAETAGKKAGDGQVIMHPDDCAVIAPIIAARPASLIIEANAALQRGDIRIRFDGIELDDLIDQRLTQSKPRGDAPLTETPLAETPQDSTSTGSGDSEAGE